MRARAFRSTHTDATWSEGDSFEAGAQDRAVSLATALEAARRSTWLSSQPDTVSAELLKHARLQSFGPGEMIIHLNTQGSGLHFLVQGSVEISTPQRGDELLPVHFLPALNWFGEYTAMTGWPSPAEYRARPACRTVCIPRPAMALLAHDASFAAAALQLLAQGLQSLLLQFGDLAGPTAAGRIKSKLLSLSYSDGQPRDGCVIPVSQGELAMLACVSRFSVNKVLTTLEKRGVVEVGYRSIKIRNVGALIKN
jgi:CRP/FNR family cyclic AMP-dependent transcriptional regulator